jgi:hypothetical protein
VLTADGAAYITNQTPGTGPRLLVRRGHYDYGAVDIMVTLHCIGYFIGASVIAATSASFLPRVDSPRSQLTTDALVAMNHPMPSPIPSLVRSLDLPDGQANAVLNVFSDYPTVNEFLTGESEDGSMLTSAACAVLKLILGETKVNSKPVNATLTDDNWLVSIMLGLLPLEFLGTYFRLQVTNMLEVAQLRCSGREQERCFCGYEDYQIPQAQVRYTQRRTFTKSRMVVDW